MIQCQLPTHYRTPTLQSLLALLLFSLYSPFFLILSHPRLRLLIYPKKQFCSDERQATPLWQEDVSAAIARDPLDQNVVETDTAPEATADDAMMTTLDAPGMTVPNDTDRAAHGAEAAMPPTGETTARVRVDAEM